MDTDKGAEEVITKSNDQILGEDVVREHSYYKINTNKILSYHLTDHNYFLNRTPPQPKSIKKVPKRKREIKITELRAVYNCKSCGYRTMNREVFSKHVCDNKKLQEPKYVPCIKCNSTTTLEGFEKCTECSYFTKTKASLKVHMRIHADRTPYKCTECNFCGKQLKDLIKHNEETKDLECFCGYTTHVKNQMLRHKRSHAEETPFSCGECNFATSDRAGLHKHLEKHEGDSSLGLNI